jgi:hypothetical protein
VPSDKYLDSALDQQSQRLFDAEAIIESVAAAIEERFDEEIARVEDGAPNYPRALRQSVALIREPYSRLELAALEPLALKLQQEAERAED